MISKTELLPCPFCGSEAETVVDDGAHWERCKQCGSTGPLGSKYSEEHETSWNTRAAPAEDVSTVVNEPVAWKQAFDEWYSRNPYDDLTHATVAYMAFQAGASLRRPQRKVVMPEDFKGLLQDILSWNDSNKTWHEMEIRIRHCLDEFARLNPE